MFLGSGLLYVAMMFVADATAGAAVVLLQNAPSSLPASAAYFSGRAEIYRTTAVYSTSIKWRAAPFPFLVLLISVCILVQNRGKWSGSGGETRPAARAE